MAGISDDDEGWLEEWIEEVKASLPGVVKRGSVCVWDTKGRVVPIAEGTFVYVHLSYCSKLTDGDKMVSLPSGFRFGAEGRRQES